VGAFGLQRTLVISRAWMAAMEETRTMATSKRKSLPPRLKIPEELIEERLGTKAPQASDAATLKDLILWARKERVNITHITVGSCSLVMVDNAAYSHELHRRGTEVEPKGPGGLYEQFGGALLGGDGAPAAVETVEPTVEDDDE
jgi:hypothetical protein